MTVLSIKKNWILYRLKLTRSLQGADSSIWAIIHFGSKLAIWVFYRVLSRTFKIFPANEPKTIDIPCPKYIRNNSATEEWTDDIVKMETLEKENYDYSFKISQIFNTGNIQLFDHCMSDTINILLTSKITPSVFVTLICKQLIIIIIIINKDWQCKAGRGRLTPYQSEDPSPILPTYRGKEEKGK